MILLDTHILVRLAIGQLSEARLELLRTVKELYISSISLWEVAKLVEYKRIEIEEGLGVFLERVHGNSNFTVVDLLPEILVKIASIAPQVGKDPADQIIVATALFLRARLMSDDSKMIESKLIEML